jgi:hypothetical protein
MESLSSDRRGSEGTCRDPGDQCEADPAHVVTSGGIHAHPGRRTHAVIVRGPKRSRIRIRSDRPGCRRESGAPAAAAG